MSQCERILKYMQDFGSITTLDAVKDLGCLRLASRIYDLKRQGHNIADKPETGKNRYGESVRYKRYYLKS